VLQPKAIPPAAASLQRSFFATNFTNYTKKG